MAPPGRVGCMASISLSVDVESSTYHCTGSIHPSIGPNDISTLESAGPRTCHCRTVGVPANARKTIERWRLEPNRPENLRSIFDCCSNTKVVQAAACRTLSAGTELTVTEKRHAGDGHTRKQGTITSELLCRHYAIF